MPPRKYTEDLTGRVFGKLTITGRSKRGNRWWVAACSCGNVRVLAQHELQQGRYASCGCELARRGRLRRIRIPFSPRQMEEDFEVGEE